MKMKRNLFYLITTFNLLFLCSNLFGQEKVVLEDFFNRSDNSWTENSSKASLSGGKLYLTNTSQSSDGKVTKPLSNEISSMNDFKLSCDVKLLGTGVQSGRAGIELGNKKMSDRIFFYITNDEKFHTQFVKNRQVAEKSDWISEPVIKLGKTNRLEIIKNASKAYFFINGKWVHSFKVDEDITFDVVSLGISANRKAAFDNVIIKYSPAKSINLVKDSSQGYKLTNLGKGVNSKYTEMIPFVSADGKNLYFTRLDHPNNLGDANNAGDIWKSSRDKYDSWGEAENLNQPINNTNNGNTNFIVAITADGNKMYLRGLYNDSFSPIYKTTQLDSGWSMPEPMPVDEFDFNGKLVNVCMSPDEKKIIFSIKRDDSRGERDLFVSFLKADRKSWTKPKHMGDVINTVGDDSSPFIAADGKTLYYSTDGFPGFGGKDIFVTKRLDESWTMWSEPQNIGADINSARDEIDYKIPASSEFAYMASSSNLDGAMGKSDIYKIKVTDGAKPEPVVLVYGKVLNSKTKEPIAANISCNSLKDNKQVAAAISNPSTGAYQIVLPYGKIYSLIAEKSGFFSVSENLDVIDVSTYTEIEKDLYLTPIEAGQSIRLNNVFFEFNKSYLKPASYPELDRLVDLLNKNQDLTIEISGHTDSIGSATYNKALSERRAKSVKDYLFEKGMTEERVNSHGYGLEYPIAQNDTEIGRSINRRVEFTILGNGVSGYPDSYTGLDYNLTNDSTEASKIQGVNILISRYIGEKSYTFSQRKKGESEVDYKIRVNDATNKIQKEKIRAEAIDYYANQLLSLEDAAISFDADKNETIIDIDGVKPFRIAMSRKKYYSLKATWPKSIVGKPVYDFDNDDEIFVMAFLKLNVLSETFKEDNILGLVDEHLEENSVRRAHSLYELLPGSYFSQNDSSLNHQIYQSIENSISQQVYDALTKFADQYIAQKDYSSAKKIYEAARQYNDSNSGELLSMLTTIEQEIDKREHPGKYLSNAVKNSNTVEVRTLLALGANPDLESSDGTSIIFDAIDLEKPNILKLLIENDANLDKIHSDGDTPLMHAIKKDKKEMASILIEKGASLSRRNNNNENAMHYAVKYKANDLLSLVLSKETMNGINSEGETPIHYAVTYDNYDAAYELINNDALVSYKNKNGLTPLLLAVKLKKLDFIRLLLRNDGLTNDKFEGNISPLEYAINNNLFNVAEVLINYGGGIQKFDLGSGENNLLIQSIVSKNNDYAKLLVYEGADLSITASSKKWTPLHYAASIGNEEVASAIVAKDPELTKVKDLYNDKPKNIAKDKGYKELAKML